MDFLILIEIEDQSYNSSCLYAFSFIHFRCLCICYDLYVRVKHRVLFWFFSKLISMTVRWIQLNTLVVRNLLRLPISSNRLWSNIRKQLVFTAFVVFQTFVCGCRVFLINFLIFRSFKEKIWNYRLYRRIRHSKFKRRFSSTLSKFFKL